MDSRECVRSVDNRSGPRSRLAAAMVAFAGIGFSATGHALSLEEAVRAAVTTHPQVSAAQAERRAAEQEVRQARAGYYPSLELNAGIGREFSSIDQLRAAGLDARAMTRREAGLTLTQTLFDGLATRNHVDAATASLQAADSRATDKREAVALKAVQVYLDVVRARRLVALAEANVASHLDMADKVGLGVRRGVSQRADLQQAMGRLALARSTLVARQAKVLEAETNYARVVGEPPPADLLEPKVAEATFVRAGALNTELLSRSRSEATSVALKENPSLKAALADVDAAAAAARAARAGYMPKIFLEVRADKDRNLSGVKGASNISALMLMAQWNLYRGGADEAREKALVERRFAAQDTALDSRRAVEAGVALSLQSAATSQERLVHLKEYVTESELTLHSYRAQRELGRRSLLDVLNAESELFTARSNLEEARIDTILDHYYVQASQGRLTQSLGLSAAD